MGAPANRRSPLGLGMPNKVVVIALLALAAAGLAACGTVPGSVEEQLWFDKATGYDINHVPPEARYAGVRGWPRTDHGFYRPAPPDPYLDPQ